MIHLEPITVDNWRTRLAVSEAQREYVANSTVLLARAYAYRDMGSYACMIFNDDTPVGMALYYDCPELGEYVFSQLFIDERYQGRGYGKTAAKRILDKMRAEGKFRKVGLCYVEGNDAAKVMYEGLGFYHTGEADEDEIVMECDLYQI